MGVAVLFLFSKFSTFCNTFFVESLNSTKRLLSLSKKRKLSVWQCVHYFLLVLKTFLNLPIFGRKCANLLCYYSITYWDLINNLCNWKIVKQVKFLARSILAAIVKTIDLYTTLLTCRQFTTLRDNYLPSRSVMW